MAEYARKAVRIASGRARTDLDNDESLVLALTRAVEVIGEAANRVPRDLQAEHPEVPWSQIIGMRNRLIHGYDAVDHDVL